MSKKKIISAIEHQGGGIPVDFGSGPTTGIHCSVIMDLRKHFGLESKPVKIVEPYQMLGEVDEELKSILGIETESVTARNGMFGFTNEDWKVWQTPWAQEVLVPGKFNTDVGDNGDILIYPEGDRAAAASGRMPASSYFFDSIIRQKYFNEENLDPEDNLEEFGLWGKEDIEYIKKEAERVRDLDRYVLANLGGTSLGDIALIPAPFLKDPKGIRDITEWYISTVIRSDYIHAVFEKQSEIALENLKKAFDVSGSAFDAIYLCGTDFGTQSSTFCSAGTFRELWMPYYQKMTGWIHKNTHWKVFKHSCGAVSSFYPLFIEAGFDLINPVQLSADGMDPRTLKSNYGRDVVFWGGGVDTQQTLPFGSPEDVRKEVLANCKIFSKSGGFVFNTVHNVQAQTPVENFIAMIDGLNEFNGTH
ncbi:MAG: methyltransferase [Spirochaetales bacterium]|nr:methyltransferase [Spirochaetales bacterium]